MVMLLSKQASRSSAMPHPLHSITTIQEENSLTSDTKYGFGAV